MLTRAPSGCPTLSPLVVHVESFVGRRRYMGRIVPTHLKGKSKLPNPKKYSGGSNRSSGEPPNEKVKMKLVVRVCWL